MGRLLLEERGLVPTRVGMILSGGVIFLFTKPCPHTRGDDPNDYQEESEVKNLSPHAWG